MLQPPVPYFSVGRPPGAVQLLDIDGIIPCAPPRVVRASQGCGGRIHHGEVGRCGAAAHKIDQGRGSGFLVPSELRPPRGGAGWQAAADKIMDGDQVLAAI
jgi:hypothetical protein